MRECRFVPGDKVIRFQDWILQWVKNADKAKLKRMTWEYTVLMTHCSWEREAWLVWIVAENGDIFPTTDCELLDAPEQEEAQKRKRWLRACDTPQRLIEYLRGDRGAGGPPR